MRKDSLRSEVGLPNEHTVGFDRLADVKYSGLVLICLRSNPTSQWSRLCVNEGVMCLGMQNYGKLLRFRVNNILYRNFGL